MKKLFFFFILSLLVLLALPVLRVLPAHATSQQAYQDYLFQFDRYRQTNSAFQVAKNEYLKFRTLTAQTSALEATKTMLAQRDALLRAYLLLLNEKLNEDQGLSGATRGQYQGIIRNEITFLETHTQLIPSIGSLGDANTVSRQLESHYKILQASERQIIGGLAIGNLTRLSSLYDVLLSRLQAYVATNGGIFSTTKQATLNRWLLQISDKRRLFGQKFDTLNLANASLSSADANDIERTFNDINRMVGEAKQYLVEGNAYMAELISAMRYVD